MCHKSVFNVRDKRSTQWMQDVIICMNSVKCKLNLALELHLVAGYQSTLYYLALIFSHH